MPVTSDSPAPYAPAAAVLEIVRRHRTRGLPAPVNAEVLARSQISDSLIPRTLHALKALDLIDEDGKPTETFEGLRLAPEGDFQSRLQAWLNNAYADVIKFANPETADETALRDAFRTYKPVGQQARMVSLFSGLYAAAGIVPEKKASARANGTARRVRKPPVLAPRDPAVASEPTFAPKALVQAHQDTRAFPEMSDKALEYKLVDLLKHDDIADDQRAAVWTLIQYLTAKARGPARSGIEE